MSYIVIEGHGMDNLIAAVNEYIKKGWKPIGDVAVDTTSMGTWWYFQAMIKE